MRTLTRTTLLLAIVLALLAVFSGVARGQDDDGPTIELSGDDITVDEDDDGEPTYSVEEAGDYDVTITGSGFSVDVFVLQCPGAAGSLEALEEGDPTSLCDLGNLQPASPDDEGGFEVTFEGVTVDGCGLVFAAGDSAGTEGAQALLSVANPPEDTECEVVESEGYDEGLQEGDGATSAAGQDDDLANTGLNSTEMALVALAVVAAGALITFEARRMVSAR